jgi:hypothetical protein
MTIVVSSAHRLAMCYTAQSKGAGIFILTAVYKAMQKKQRITRTLYLVAMDGYPIEDGSRKD